MPTISIRVSDELKSRLDNLAQESENTISAIITEALNSITGIGRKDFPEQTAPYTLNSTSRLILRNQEQLFLTGGTLDESERACHEINIRILEGGFTGEYGRLFGGIHSEIPYDRSNELYDILDMFRVLRTSYNNLTAEERAKVEERSISFRGFDYNDSDESPLSDYVKFLFEDDRYTELKEPLARFSDDGNSHHRNLNTYRRMNRCFNQVWRKHILSFDLLSLEEIVQVVDAARYDSSY